MLRECADGVVYYRFGGLSQANDLAHAALTRIGGVSAPPYATLNLGHTVGDDIGAVEENHRRALSLFGFEVDQTVSPYQVHGARVGLVGRAHRGTVQPSCDALVTDTPGVPLLLRFADCVPILLYDPVRRAIGVAHAGWRGAMANVVGATVRALVERLGCEPDRVWAGIGPAIGPCCYEVEADVVAAVQTACPVDARISRQAAGRTFLDLPGVVRTQLQAAGVSWIEDSNLCTACHVDEFFSHRLERGTTGRFGVLMGLLE
jgi:YfiH family protein